MTVIRPELETLPPRLRKLPLDAHGYPVPWFVAWVPDPSGGPDVPEFRAMDARKFVAAVKQRLCWVCGEPLGGWLAFPIGPMCAITRTISEPPSHRECAEWSIRNCPFLAQPAMVRREDADLLAAGAQEPAGVGLKRNPGVTCLWITRSYELFDDGRGGKLITIGSPEHVSWWREGRAATLAEVEESVSSGFPNLLVSAQRDGPFAVEQLGKYYERARLMFPAALTESPAAGAVAGTVD